MVRVVGWGVWGGSFGVLGWVLEYAGRSAPEIRLIECHNTQLSFPRAHVKHKSRTKSLLEKHQEKVAKEEKAAKKARAGKPPERVPWSRLVVYVC